MGSHLLSIIYGLGAALSFGAGDFAGGIVTKKSPVFSVIIFSQLTGGLMLFGLVVFSGQTLPGLYDLFLGCLAGICGTMGLTCLYKGLSNGKMGVVAPVAAVVSALFPVLVGIFIQGLPGMSQLAGFVLAIIAVWLLSGGGAKTPILFSELKLPVAAGLGFGMFFIIISQVSTDSILWPLISARVASITLFVPIATIKQKNLIPLKENFPMIILAGVCDAAGTIFFVLASTIGRLDISVVVTSIYPAITVLLALFILKEKLTKAQWAGFWIVLLALILIAQN
ncbi:MAG: DMT family transporter [Desulfobacula sp.]|nr:DMT family transporter [Desulfobacula sp.]